LQGFVLSGKSLERTFISSLAAAAMTTTVVDSSADSHDGGVAALQAIRYTRGRGLQLLDQVRGFVHFVTFDNELCLMMSLSPKELHTYVEAQIQETSSSVNSLQLRRGRRRTNVFFLLKSVTNFFQSVFQEFSPEYLRLLLMIILLFYVLFPAQVAIGGCVHRDPGCNRRLVKCGIISPC
jgi:hypothetical protein